LQSRRQLNILTALPAEAKPLINSFTLQRHQPVGSIPLFQAPGIQLAISGPGFNSISQAVNYLLEMTAENNPVWLNLGICGHGSLAIGELMLVDQVIEPDGRNWQLVSPTDLIQNSGRLTCVSTPQANYQPEMAYDMESAGFLASLTTTTPVESLHILKIVSDNPENAIESINAKWVNKLITAQISQIREFIFQVSGNG
jgi:nucleoside phosphorylase